MNLRMSFHLQRAGNWLGKVRDVATALSFAGGRLTPLSALGIGAHLASFLVSIASKDLADVVSGWPKMTQAQELHSIMRDALLPMVRRRVDSWMHCEVEGQSVLVSMAEDWAAGSFYAERDVEAITSWMRAQTWERLGLQLTLAPVGRWGEGVTLRPTAKAPTLDSERAREVWQRVRPMVLAGEPRSVLLDGPPRTGKSTIARQLLVHAAADLGRPLRVLRISVSDFSYLNPSVVQAAVDFLRPDALVLDDIDRFAGIDQLLDLFEAVRATTALLITTSNHAEKLPLALRLPGRIDETLVIAGAGDDLAAEVMGFAWQALTCEQRAVVASWPVKLVDELRIRLQHLGTSAAVEIANLQGRLESAKPPETAAPVPALAVKMDACPAVAIAL